MLSKEWPPNESDFTIKLDASNYFGEELNSKNELQKPFWAAVDQDGSMWIFKDKPILSYQTWQPDKKESLRCHEFIAEVDLNGANWKETLILVEDK